MSAHVVFYEGDWPVIEDFQSLFLSGAGLLDTRAPVEFAAGAFPSATNLPLMNNKERELVGTCYKTAGQDSAIALGNQLVQGEIKDGRVASWLQFITHNPAGALYCFRGGLRSRTVQQWIYEHSGVRYPRVQGGYKALRHYLLQQLDYLPTQYQPYVLSGRTGSGKTVLLKMFQQQVDLEGLANHRGSAFGPQITPQPSQIDFENTLALQLLNLHARGYKRLLFEDESPNIGSVHLPGGFFDQLKQADLVMLDVSNAERTAISYQEYVIDMVAAFQQQQNDVERGIQAYGEYILGSLSKIRRRLGGVRYDSVQKMMTTALDDQRLTGSTEAHQEWVKFILFDYYDPMYDYQLGKKQARLVFRGDKTEVAEYLAEQGIH